jgi:hypothetical protein
MQSGYLASSQTGWSRTCHDGGPLYHARRNEILDLLKVAAEEEDTTTANLHFHRSMIPLREAETGASDVDIPSLVRQRRWKPRYWILHHAAEVLPTTLHPMERLLDLLHRVATIEADYAVNTAEVVMEGNL